MEVRRHPGTTQQPSESLAAEKAAFGSNRLQRVWSSRRARRCQLRQGGCIIKRWLEGAPALSAHRSPAEVAGSTPFVVCITGRSLPALRVRLETQCGTSGASVGLAGEIVRRRRGCGLKKGPGCSGQE